MNSEHSRFIDRHRLHGQSRRLLSSFHARWGRAPVPAFLAVPIEVDRCIRVAVGFVPTRTPEHPAREGFHLRVLCPALGAGLRRCKPSIGLDNRVAKPLGLVTQLAQELAHAGVGNRQARLWFFAMPRTFKLSTLIFPAWRTMRPVA
jgi:hypothetical protein